MPTEAIACNQCGAPLQVPDSARFLACNHCGASLAVRREATVTYTEVVEQLAEHTSKLAEQVAHLRYQNELNRVDREWDEERKQYLVSTKNGPPREPTQSGANVGGVAFAAVGLFMMFAIAANGGGGIALVGLLIAGFGAIAAVVGSHKASLYQRAHADYRRRKASVTVERFLDEARAEPDGSGSSPRE